MKQKRFRTPKLKDGELRVYWGKLPGDCPDVVFSYQGDASMRRDSSLLHYHLATQRPDWRVQPLFSKMCPSLIEELVARGYDITTLRFSIMKKQPSGSGSSGKEGGMMNDIEIQIADALMEAQNNEIEHLRAELAKHQESEYHPDHSKLESTRESLREHMAMVATLKAENEALRRDAERYRYIRYNGYVEFACNSPREEWSCKQLDAAIDAAMKGEK